MKFSKNRILLAALTSSLIAQGAWANVIVFQPDKAPQQIAATLQVAQVPNDSSAAESLLGFLEEHQSALDLTPNEPIQLALIRSETMPEGLALRFVQVHEGAPIDGAELIALFKNDRTLHSLNSSLVSLASLQTGLPNDVKITEKLALRLAKSYLKIAKLRSNQAPFGKLKLVSFKQRLHWVWEFAITPPTSKSPTKVQIIASGKQKGQLLKAIPLATGIMSNDISIYDASTVLVMPSPIYKGVLVLKNGKRAGTGRLHLPKSARAADSNLRSSLGFYDAFFGRNSFDDNGAPVIASVNALHWTGRLDLLGMQQNAAWMGPFNMFVFGSGGALLGDFAESLDVVAHEFTHAVIQYSSNLEYQGQSGGLNEHFADVFGAIIENHFQPSDTPYLIGEKVLRGKFKEQFAAMRDMLDPHKSLGFDKDDKPKGQPAHIEEIDEKFGASCIPTGDNDQCGVHDINGVPNKVAALIWRDLGWEPTYRLFYRVMTVRLRANSNFMDYSHQLLDECHLTLAAEQCKIVENSLAAVGL